MAYNAKAVANYFLKLAKDKGNSLTPMKLQKLVFFAHGWHLAIFNKPLIADTVEVWRFGPVVPSLYHEFKHVGSGSIASMATELDLENFDFIEPSLPDDDRQTKALLDKIFDSYSQYSAIQLSNLTHLAGTPWDQVRKAGLDSGNKPIDDSLISKYFKDQATEKRAAQNV